MTIMRDSALLECVVNLIEMVDRFALKQIRTQAVAHPRSLIQAGEPVPNAGALPTEKIPVMKQLGK